MKGEPLQTKLLEQGASNPDGNRFGFSVAMSDRYFAVGARYSEDAAPAVGTVKIYDARTRRFLRTFFTSELHGGFGESVAVSGRLLLAGAPLTGVAQKGAAYVYDIPTGRLIAKLTAPSPQDFDKFGTRVALSGDIALVGSWGSDRAFVYHARTGQLLHELSGDDSVPSVFFGYSVSLCGRIAVIGANGVDDSHVDQGRAYLFDVLTGQQLAVLEQDDPADYDSFGKEVAIDGPWVLVSAPHKATNLGAVYVFDSRSGQLLRKLTDPTGNPGEQFGTSVAVSGNLALIGDFFDGANDGSSNGNGEGSAFVFDLTTGELVSKIWADVADTSDQFGLRVALSGDEALVGAPGDDDNGSEAGAVYHFTQLTRPFPAVTLAKTGDSAPGVADATFRGFGQSAVFDESSITIEGFLRGPGSNRNRDRGLWWNQSQDLNLLAKSRDEVAALGTNVRFRRVFDPISNHQYHASLSGPILTALLSGPGITARNNRAILASGSGGFVPLIATGEPRLEFGDAEVQAFREVLQAAPFGEVLLSFQLRRNGALGITRRNDTGLVNYDPPSGVPYRSSVHEGSAGPGGVTYGQFFGRAGSSSVDEGVAFGAFAIPAAGGRAVPTIFSDSNDFSGPVEVMRQGDEVPGLEPGQVFRTFTGEGVHGLNEATVVRAMLAGPGISGRNNEMLWSSDTQSPMLQKGQLMGTDDARFPDEVVVSRIYRFWPTGENSGLAQVRLGGRRVSAANDLALLFLKYEVTQSNWEAAVVLREGDEVCGFDAARIRLIQRVEVNPVSGDFAVQVAVTGSRGNNQALYVGTAFTGASEFLEQTRPRLLLRKGTRFLMPDSMETATLRSVLLQPYPERTGIGARGHGRAVGADGAVVVTLQLDREKRVAVFPGLP